MPYVLAAWLFLVGLYGMVTSRNFVHLVMCLGVLQSSTYVLLLQIGYKAGGTVGIATKAGTNSYHGDLFEFARNHRFNATSPFASVNPKTGKRFDDGLVRNQFGGVLGGPIVKDRVQFFAAYQGTRTTQTPADSITFIPTAAMLAGDFSTVASAQCRAQGNREEEGVHKRRLFRRCAQAALHFRASPA